MSYRDTNMTQGFRATSEQLDWGAEEGYWRDNWASRPYASADLGYAVSTYTHRILSYTGRRPGQGSVRDETVSLQDALDAFSREVRTMADAYRSLVGTPPRDESPSR